MRMQVYRRHEACENVRGIIMSVVGVLTRLGRVRMNLQKMMSIIHLCSSLTNTYPTKCDQLPLLRDLQHEFLLIHSTRIARRVLLRDQQHRHNVLALDLLPQQKPTSLLIALSIDPSNREESRQAIARHLH